MQGAYTYCISEDSFLHTLYGNLNLLLLQYTIYIIEKEVTVNTQEPRGGTFLSP